MRAVDVFVKGVTYRRPVTKKVKLLGEDQETSSLGEYVQIIERPL